MLLRHNRPAVVRVMPRQSERRPYGRPGMDFRPGERPSERRPIVTDGHVPVMVSEVLALLVPSPGGVYVDCTVGGGGHAEAILRAVKGRCTLIGIDKDPYALARAKHNLMSFGRSVRLVASGFEDLAWILAGQTYETVDGILIDLGMSSMQIDDPVRGFSFRNDGPLDMRMDPSTELTAAHVVNSYTIDGLTRVLRDFGEERYARRIAAAITAARKKSPIRSTASLAKVVADAYPGAGRKSGHPARQTFQALRIEVNGELDNLDVALRTAAEVLSPGGRIVVISYHSLEDKLVKRHFQNTLDPAFPGLGPVDSDAALRPLTRGAVLPTEDETTNNPRASAARVRAAVKVAH